MRSWPRNRDRWGGQAVLVALLACLLCAGQQEPAKPAAPAAPAPTEAPDQPAAEKATAPTAAAPALPQAGVITANILVVRARPAPHYERIGQFARGDKVTIVGGNADWYEVRVPADTRAWIASQYLSAEGIVTADQVRLHSGPGLVFTTFCTIKQGAKLDVLGPPVDGWQQVRAPIDANAWISRAYVRALDPEPPAAVEAPAETKAEAPAETKAEAPAETKAEAPADTKGEAPAETKVEAPAETKAEAPVETKAEAPAETKVEAPAETKAEAPAETKAEAPVETKAEAPAETKVEAPAETKAEAPATEPIATHRPAVTAPPMAAPAAAAVTPPAPAVVELQLPPPPAAGTVIVPATPAADAPIVMKEGVLLSLRGQASELASHVLCMRVGGTAYPICYLKSVRLDLTEWENRDVRVYGREQHLPGWSLRVLHVHSIQINLKQ
jgi:uncharacterized protein YgiM (DUF1202 family)